LQILNAQVLDSLQQLVRRNKLIDIAVNLGLEDVGFKYVPNILNFVLDHLFRHKQEDLLGDVNHLVFVQVFFFYLFVAVGAFLLLLVVALVFILFVFINGICLLSLVLLRLFFGGFRLLVVALG
jgi:hypothetical protein